MKFGAALSIAGVSVTATLFILQINPSSVASSVSSSDTTLGAFLLAFLRGSFLDWGVGRATTASGPAGGDWPWRRRSPQQSLRPFGSPPPACGIWLWRVAQPFYLSPASYLHYWPTITKQHKIWCLTLHRKTSSIRQCMGKAKTTHKSEQHRQSKGRTIQV